MPPVDFKKTQRELYQPKITPGIIDVPSMTFLAVDGIGDPNTSAEYAAAIETLYALSYSIKMNNKHILEYVVPPLEGFWATTDDFKGGAASIPNKDNFVWTTLIRQPDFVTEEIFDAARAHLAEKKPHIDTGKARLIQLTEGLCAQIMPIVPYDDEPASIVAMEHYVRENGYETDITPTRRHHEIYLSDPRKVAPEKQKTIIRHPIKKA